MSSSVSLCWWRHYRNSVPHHPLALPVYVNNIKCKNSKDKERKRWMSHQFVKQTLWAPNSWIKFGAFIRTKNATLTSHHIQNIRRALPTHEEPSCPLSFDISITHQFLYLYLNIFAFRAEYNYQTITTFHPSMEFYIQRKSARWCINVA